MRKLLLLVCLTASLSVFAQNSSVADMSNKSNTVKTASQQDLLTNIIQVAGQNLTSDNKGVILKATAWGLNFKDSAKKYNNSYYMRRLWQKNTQFLLGAGIDKNGNINAIQGGIAFNLVNRSDTTQYDAYYSLDKTQIAELDKIQTSAVASVRQSKQHELNEKLFFIAKASHDKGNSDSLFKAMPGILAVSANNPIVDSCMKLKTFIDSIIQIKYFDTATVQEHINAFSLVIVHNFFTKPLTEALDNYITSKGKTAIQPSGLLDTAMINQVIKDIDNQISGDKKMHGSNLLEADAYLQEEYDSLVQVRARRSLLVGGYNFTSGSTSPSAGHVFSLQYLVGLNNKSLKKPWQLTAAAYDSINVDSTSKNHSLGRNVSAVLFGLNKVIYIDQPSNTSLLEGSLALEEDHVFNGIYNNENQDKWFASFTLQARLPKSPWLKFTVKYDKDKGVFLGLLDLTLNLDSTTK